jgi:hypothetical protein
VAGPVALANARLHTLRGDGQAALTDVARAEEPRAAGRKIDDAT